MIWQATARQAVAHLRKRPAGTGELARACNVDPAFLDDALAPLVDAGKLMRINAFRGGAAEFDYRFSATWVPVDGDFDLCKGGGHAPVAAISPVAPATPGPLSSLNVTAKVPAHVARPVQQEERVSSGKSGAASKHAGAALDRALTQSPQSLGWAPAPEATHAHHQESTVPTKKRNPYPTKASSAQFQICALLMAGDRSREELSADVSADAKAFYNGVYQAKQAGRIEFIEKTGKFCLTPAGKAWTTGGANLDNQKAAGASPNEVKRGRRSPREKSTGLPKGEKARLGVVDVRGDGKPRKAIAPTQVVQDRAFRCAVYSDGGFGLTKGGQTIELDAQEHAQMLHYLERMAEQAA